MTELIEKLNPPGKSKKNRAAIFRIIGRVGDTVSNDINKVSRAFFPYLCDSRMLKRHGAALQINRFPNETEDAHRLRVATGASWMSEQGLRGQFYDVLNQLIPDRYDVFEAPKDCFTVGFSQIGVDRVGGDSTFIVINVRDLTQAEYDLIYDSLDQFLDPDIEIIINPWVSAGMENLTLEQIRLYGGGDWLATQYSDLCYLEIKIMPDDAFTVGVSRLGEALVYGKDPAQVVLVYCDDSYADKVSSRTETLLENSINWEVISG